ncbi:MAG: hypothetical protein AAF845_08275 [Bacteroidota bacterium]
MLVVAYRALALPAPVRPAVPEADSVRAAFAPDTTQRRPEAVAVAPGRAPPAITTTGSITRGVVAGNNRDVSVTSGLRLSLAGEVAPGVTLRAALTDENTPILPEGSTQQLSDLDRVFVEVEGPGVTARLGDVDLVLPGTAFAPLARQVQGASVEAAVPASGAFAGGTVFGSASATEGRFRSQDLVAVEGVQGPYRLEGDAGEAFVVVVPGSERVFLDGRRLTRGEAADYTVDYGTGEITFTPANLITAERRITVDFEFTAGGFARTLLAGGAEAGLWAVDGVPRARLGVRVLREADGASFASDLGLTAADLDAIAAAGDRDVLIPGAVAVPFDAESPFVLYARRDTVIDGQQTPFFVPAVPGDPEVFRVRFTRVAAGQGAYRRAGQARNGILYEFVGPGRGDAIPFRILPRPAARSLVDVAGEVTLVPGLRLGAEWAQSVDDANTLSALDAADDRAGAIDLGLRLDPTAIRLGTLSGRLTHQARADAFRPLDRVRDVEFNRRWNLARAGTPFGSALDSLGEDVTEVALAWTLDERVALSADGGRLALGDFRSDRLAGALRLGAPGTAGLGGWGVLDAEAAGSWTGGAGPVADGLGTGAFERARASWVRSVGVWLPGVSVERERREQRGGGLPQDTLLTASYAFSAVRTRLGVETRALSGDASVEWRREDEPLGPRGQEAPLAGAARVLTVEASGRLRPRGGLSADTRVAYRRRQFNDAFRAFGREDAESVALRLGARAATAPVDLRLVYDALTERSPIRQETYVLVGQDLGEFVWRDGEGEPRAGEPDGVAQVDEFFPETTPLEGTYLRTFIPSQELVPTVGVGLRLRLGVQPGRIVGGEGTVARALRQVRLATTVDLREQTRERDVLRVLLLDPAVLQRSDPEAGTVTGRFRVEQEVVLFPERLRTGVRLGAEHLQSTSRLAAGLEERLTQALRAEVRAPLGAALDLRLEAVVDRRRTESEAFASRTYDLRGLSFEPALTWAPSASFSLTAAPLVADRTDALAPETRPSGAFVLRVPVEAHWAQAGRLSLTARVERSDVRLRGGAGGGLALFELTEGRGAGVSYLWGLNGQVGLTDQLRATVAYDARAPASAPVIQTVRVQVSAVF